MERNDTGNYDDLAELVRVKAQADMVVVIVVNGSRGTSSAVRVRDRAVTREQAERLICDIVANAADRAAQRQKAEAT
jgi:hypothetical protein